MRHFVLGLLALAACTADRGEPPFQDVPVTDTWSIPELSAGAFVVRVEGSIPHVYATNREDLARLQGFTQAQDRYFEMEMARRLGLGEISALLGDAALGTDMETRGNGATWIADRMLAEMDPDTRALYDAYAEGINAYVAAVLAEDLPPPSEFELAAGLLGRESPLDLMSTWDARDVAGATATILFNLGFEGGDVGRQGTEDALDGLFEGAPFESERRAGARADLWEQIQPIYPVSSAAGWGLDTAEAGPQERRASTPPKAPLSLLETVATHNDGVARRMGHDWVNGFGSNAWAVAGSASTDGRALFAGDGHLPLTVPALFWQVGLHSLDPLEPFDQVGMTLPGMPAMAVGTNGYVAWGQTQLMGDITDWYVEEVHLGANGEPTESLFQGEWKPLHRFEETYEVANVPILGSEGRTETWARWVTFDGRWIAGIEGRPATATTVPADGEALVNVRGDFVIPDDVDEDGTVTAISFDYVGFDVVDLMRPVEGFGTARDVGEFRDATRGLLAYSQNMVAADRDGSILYTGYQAVPCRSYLPRNGDGTWIAGADPNLLLDGTQYGGFSIPLLDNGDVDESHAADPYACVVPFGRYPQALDPERGYVLTANNDPGNISIDGSLANDPFYIGGPWMEGYRANRIETVLSEEIGADTADLAAMQTLQADHHSVLAEQFLTELVVSIDVARTASQSASADPADVRLAALYDADAEAYDEVTTRLVAWRDAGLAARSGVETFYDPLLPGDAEASVATTIFNAWIGRFVRGVFDDESLPGVWQPTGATGQLRGLTRILAGRGAGNPIALASWIPETEESVFFDVLSTPEVETSHEVALIALAQALDYLRAPETDPGEGGFGTDDMSKWIWGEKHWVHFDSVLAEFLGDDPTYAVLTERFAITPEVLPLEGKFANWPGFPRHGDHLNIDAGNSGLSGGDFDYGSGPVFRMVVALGPDGAEGYNILPGGQSGLADSEYFADQAELWLGNEVWPMRLTRAEVEEGAVGREVFSP